MSFNYRICVPFKAAELCSFTAAANKHRQPQISAVQVRDLIASEDARTYPQVKYRCHRLK